MVAALVRGSKHWTFEMTEQLWEWLAPLVRKALEKVNRNWFSSWFTLNISTHNMAAVLLLFPT